MQSSRQRGSRKRLIGQIAAGVVVAGMAAVAGTAAASQNAADPGAAPVDLVDELALPVGFKPEGITISDEPIAFFGSLADGSILRADLVTGKSAIIGVAPGTPAVGMKIDDRGRLFVAGGTSGTARVVDSATGRVLANYDLTDETQTFVNDVVLTPDGAFFTETKSLVLYHLPIVDGELPNADEVQQIPLSGAIKVVDGPLMNGIVIAPDKKRLIIVQTATGLLFNVDPASGRTTLLKVAEKGGDGLVPGGDGLLIQKNRLLVVQNKQNLLTALDLDATGDKATVKARVADDRFDVPTTVAAFGDTLFMPNARGFDDEINDQTTFNAVAVTKP